MSTLITGGTGLVGSSLKNGIKLSSKDIDLRDWNKTITKFKNINPEKVIHCAARVGGLGGNIDYSRPPRSMRRSLSESSVLSFTLFLGTQLGTMRLPFFFIPTCL